MIPFFIYAALASYQALQQPRALDEGLLLRVLRGLSNRDYQSCAEAVPSAFGLSKSTVSRRQGNRIKNRDFT